jgi:hypothetical protein
MSPRFLPLPGASNRRAGDVWRIGDTVPIKTKKYRFLTSLVQYAPEEAGVMRSEAEVLRAFRELHRRDPRCQCGSGWLIAVPSRKIGPTNGSFAATGGP